LLFETDRLTKLVDSGAFRVESERSSSKDSGDILKAACCQPKNRNDADPNQTKKKFSQ
jgi:hypothetical protein